jgi:cytochrome c oxidase subunit II
LPPSDPVLWGEKLYAKSKGCIACHSKDGTKVVGPSFLESWGNDVVLATGETVKFDENYVRESVLNPQAKARKGFETAAQMPSYQGRLKEEEISALIEFMKTIKKDATPK